MSSRGSSSFSTQEPTCWSHAYRQALDAHALVSMTDRDGVLVYVNDLFVETTGYDRDELIGSTHARVRSEHHDGGFFKSMWAELLSANRWRGEVCNRDRDGNDFWIDMDISAVRDADGEIEGYVSIGQDITERKREQAALASSEQFLQHVAAVSGVGGWSLDLERGELFWSKYTKLIHEVGLDYQPSLTTAIEFYAPEARGAITHAVETCIDTGKGWDLELPLITAKGTPIWVRAVGEAIRSNGKTVRLVGAFQNITQRKLTEDVLREEVASRHSAEQLLRDVLETIPDAVAAYDSDDRLIICNSGYMRTYAASADAIVPGASFESILRFGLARGQYAGVGSTPDEQEAWLRSRLAAHTQPPDQLVQRLRDGTWLQVREHRSESGATVGVRTDVTDIKRAEHELRRFAEEDRLTGLLNRSRFTYDLDDLLLENLDIDDDHMSCVVLFDVDFFKPINDAYGHDLGDEVLVEIARRVRAQLKPADFAARLGGDEFVFVLRDYADKRACEEVIEGLFAALKQPIETSGQRLSLSISLGIAPIEGRGQSSRELLKQADHAQYQAKAAGRGRWRWFGDADRKDIEHKQRLTAALKRSLTIDKDIAFALQPFESANGRQTLGFSAEMHWPYEGQTYDAPQLRQLAAQGNVAGALNDSLLEAIAGQIGALQGRGIDCGLIWLTISPEELRLGELACRLKALCLEHQIAPERLVVAVDEAALVERSASAIENTLLDIREVGFRLGIDCFGRAGVPLSLLQSLQIDCVRLGWRTLETTSPDARLQLAKAIVTSAQALGIAVFAGQLDEPQSLRSAIEMEVIGVQGDAVCRPLSGDAITTYLSANANKQLALMAQTMAEHASPSVDVMHADRDQDRDDKASKEAAA